MFSQSESQLNMEHNVVESGFMPSEYEHRAVDSEFVPTGYEHRIVELGFMSTEYGTPCSRPRGYAN